MDKLEIKDTDMARKYCNDGRALEQNGDRLKAIEAYEAAFTADPDDTEVCFRLAYSLDLVGEEEEAMHLYEQCIQQPNPPLNALLNLTVLYEDRGQYTKAERCVRQVLATNPNHPRAQLYIKDLTATNTMVIDDESDRKTEKHSALLDTPVTDFDLSVRTRNALRKMSVRTLGDLLRVTEADLRSYKNVGDASLDEIRAMLAQRGLRLGQAIDQQNSAAKQAMYDQLTEGTESETLDRTVNELKLTVRARKALALLNINSLADLCMRTEAELMGIKNFGMTSLLEIKEKLSAMDLCLRQLEE